MADPKPATLEEPNYYVGLARIIADNVHYRSPDLLPNKKLMVDVV